MTSVVAIATPHHSATDAAAAVVRAGGSVVDAALTAAITLTVVYPHNCGVAGDLLALYRGPGSADASINCVNASGPAAAGVDVDAMRRRNAGTMPVSGVDTVTVPGAVAGWARLHELGGRLPWRELFEAAIGFAADGIAVSRSVAAALDEQARSGTDPGWRRTFVPNGTVPVRDALLRQPALAGTLRTLANDGPASFYDGPLGERFVSHLRGLGSTLDRADLRGFRVEDATPLRRGLAGYEVWTAPPNSQGFALLRILLALQRAGHDWARPGVRDAGALASLFADAARLRDTLLADPRCADVDVDLLIEGGVAATPAAGAWPRELREAFAPGTAGAAGVSPADGHRGRRSGDTVALCVAGSDGSAVSLIQSLFYSFGSGICDPSTGIVAHNRGAMFTLDPASPNVLAAGKRPAHTLMPVLVTRGGRLRLVAGTMGGSAQPQILTQVLLGALAGRDAPQAVGAPRWVLGGTGVGTVADVVHIENGVDAEVMRRLSAGGGRQLVRLPMHSEEVGHSQLITVTDADADADADADTDADVDTDAGAGLAAAADPRSDGSAVVVPQPG